MSDPIVGLWERFELALARDPLTTDAAGSIDPYRDLRLDVTYTRPDGTTVDFWGFYDGDVTWRMRFMPDQTGTWHYHARFSDGTPGPAGAFTCVASDVPGLLAPDETNPIWFGFRGGGHLMVRSLHVGDAFFAANFADAKRHTFLDWAEAQGYNLLSVASHYLNRDAAGRGRGWETPHLWPLDAAEYRKLERMMDELAARHMMLFPFAGFFGRDADYPRDPEEQERYVRYVLARLGPYWNVLLNVAGPEPLLPNHPFMTPDEVARLGRLITSLDVFDHPLTVHNPTGDDAFKDATWTDFGTLQGPKTTDWRELRAGLMANHHPAKPLYAQETLWSGNKYHPDYSDDDLRRNAYVLLLSATAINFADNGGSKPGETGDSSSGFSGTMDLRDRRQARHDILKRAWDCLATLPFYQMTPRDDLADAGVCLADEGAHYLVYLPEGGSVNVAVTGDRPYIAEWINPRIPVERLPGGVTRDGHGLQAPNASQDWLLYLRAQDA